MKCKQVQDLILTDYLDEELSTNLENEVQAHMESCLNCREFYGVVLRTSKKPFDVKEMKSVPSEIWDHVEAEITAKKQGNPKPFFFRIPVQVATAAIFLFAVLTIPAQQIWFQSHFMAVDVKPQISEEEALFDLSETYESASFGEDIESYFL